MPERIFPLLLEIPSDSHIPNASAAYNFRWQLGIGYARFAALAIAEQNQGDAPITIVDEVERGLEPYRQRVLMGNLLAGASQVFLTTHSPAAIAATANANLWYVDHCGGIGPLESAPVERQRKHDPECFLARLTISPEGARYFSSRSTLTKLYFALTWMRGALPVFPLFRTCRP